MTLSSDNTTDISKSFGACASSYGFVAISAIPLIFVFPSWLRGRQTSQDLLISAAILAFGFYAVCAFRIFLSNEGIRYRSPLWFGNVVRWTSITDVRVGTQRRSYPPYYMEILTSDSARRIMINIKFFGRADLVQLATLICERAPQAHIDPATRQMVSGHMPSLFRGSDDSP
jgi:hypothetical protein